jgi:hypothetical protein
MTPDWLKLLQHQRREGDLALTLPFMIGALRNPIGKVFDDERAARAALDALLTSFLEERSEAGHVHIYTCPALEQPVACLSTIQYRADDLHWGAEPAVPKRLVIDWPYEFKQPTELTTAAAALWSLIGQPIVEARFSFCRRSHSYEAFTATDVRFILDAFTYDEENQL